MANLWDVMRGFQIGRESWDDAFMGRLLVVGQRIIPLRPLAINQMGQAMKSSIGIPLQKKPTTIVPSSRGAIILMMGALLMVASAAKSSAQGWVVEYSSSSVSPDTARVNHNDANFDWWVDDFTTSASTFSADESSMYFTGAGYAEAYVDIKNTTTGFNSSHNANTSYGGTPYVIWGWDGEPGDAPDEIVGIEFTSSGNLSVSGTMGFNGGTHTLAATSGGSGSVSVTDFGSWSGGGTQGSVSLTGIGYTTSGGSWVTSYNLSSSGNSTSQSFNNSVTYYISSAVYPLNTGGGVPEIWGSGSFNATTSATIAMNSPNASTGGSCYSYADVSGYVHIGHY